MPTPLTPAQIETEMKRVGGLMATYTAQFLLGIYHVISSDDGELEGTGLYIEFGGEPYILSAYHVCRRVSPLAVYGGPGRPFYLFRNPTQGVTPPQDLALSRLGRQALQQIVGPIPLAVASLATNINADGDMIFIQGYPGRHSRFLGLVGGIVSNSLAYTTTLAELPAHFDDRVNFAISYPALGNRDDADKDVALPNPGGLSGSPIWATRRNRFSGSEWAPERAEVIGIASRWLQDEGCIIATRIEVIRDQVRHFLHREAAYFSWERRGCPENDPGTDWKNVEETVSRII